LHAGSISSVPVICTSPQQQGHAMRPVTQARHFIEQPGQIDNADIVGTVQLAPQFFQGLDQPAIGGGVSAGAVGRKTRSSP
jgi:hypothetical protein